MRRIYRNKNAKDKEVLIEKIERLIDVPSVPLVVLFATQDNSNRPSWKENYNTKYDLEGFYIKYMPQEQFIPDPYPDEIKDELSLGSFRKCEHFIWISKGICEADGIHFTWVYSHELQHLMQIQKNPYLLILADLINHAGTMYEVPELDIPTEFDCERKAKEIVISIFGEDNCNSYLRKMKASSSANDKRYSGLLELDITVAFDVEQKIQQDICTKKEHFRGIQKQMEDDEITNWNINLDKLCSCRNPHEAIMSAVTSIANSQGRKRS